MTETRHSSRRQYSAQFKQQVLSEFAQPGATVASVAQLHGISANMLRKCRRLSHQPDAGEQTPAFIALPLPPADNARGADIHVQLRRGSTSVTLDWPVTAAEHCAAWMQSLALPNRTTPTRLPTHAPPA